MTYLTYILFAAGASTRAPLGRRPRTRRERRPGHGRSRGEGGPRHRGQPGRRRRHRRGRWPEAGCHVAVRGPGHRGRAPTHLRHHRRDRGPDRGGRAGGAWPCPPTWPSTPRSRPWWPAPSTTSAGWTSWSTTPPSPSSATSTSRCSRYDLIMQVNLRAPMIAIRQAVPAMRAVGGGSVVNVSSVAAMFPHPSLMAYGISKIGLERLDRRRRRSARPRPTSPSTASASTWRWPPRDSWPTPRVSTTPTGSPPRWLPRASCGWCASPPAYSGRRESMFALRRREGIMASRVPVPQATAPPEELHDGLVAVGDAGFAEPYPDDRKEPDRWPSGPPKRKRPSRPAPKDWWTRNASGAGWTPRTSRAKGRR